MYGESEELDGQASQAVVEVDEVDAIFVNGMICKSVLRCWNPDVVQDNGT